MTDAPKVKIGEREFVVLPLTLRGLRQLVKSGATKHLASMPSTLAEWSEEHIDAVIGFAFAVLSRGAPDLTSAQVEDTVELQSLLDVLPTLMAGAGLTPGGSKGEG